LDNFDTDSFGSINQKKREPYTIEPNQDEIDYRTQQDEFLKKLAQF